MCYLETNKEIIAKILSTEDCKSDYARMSHGCNFTSECLPTKEGYYDVFTNDGRHSIALFDCSGFMNEPTSFFNARDFNAKEIYAYINKNIPYEQINV